MSGNAPVARAGIGPYIATPHDRSARSILAMLGQGALVSLVFFVARVAVGVLLTSAAPSAAPASFAAEAVASLVVGFLLAWLAGGLAGSVRRRLAAIWLVSFASVAAVMIEGAAFAPQLSPPADLPVTLAGQLVVSLAAAGTAVAIVPADGRGSAAPAGARRAPWTWLARLAAAALVYVALYFLTGALNYALVTGPYYETHAGGLVNPAPSVVLVVAIVEGLMLAAAVAPLAWLIPGSRRSRALTCGLVLFVLGGVVPLIQETTLPDVIRVASVFEILFQKLPLGVAGAFLLGPPRS